jgi:hypothetical protein
MNAPEVWWSPGNTHGLDSGLIEKHQGQLYMVSASSDTTWELLDELPADAVRLVPLVILPENFLTEHDADRFAAKMADIAGAVPDTGQAREPGYERIAQAIEDVCDAAEMDIDAYRNSVGIEKPYLALARALDKAGLIDWAAFAEPSADTGQAAPEETR